MKYVVLVGDGMGDYPMAELEGRTPLAVARTPHMDRVADNGEMGTVRTLPEGCETGSDTANLSLMGYDPRDVRTRRGPLEAASLGVSLEPNDVAFRCNLVTLIGKNSERRMGDYSAGHISDAESGRIMRDIDEALGNDTFRFYPGVGYRHLMVWKGGDAAVETTPPHDITGEPVRPYLEKMNSKGPLLDVMNAAGPILENHPVNRQRRENGLSPANAIWLWGQGCPPEITSFKAKTGLRGAIISAVDLLRGIGVYAGLEVIRVPGATGYFDTDYAAKARYALEAVKDVDLVYVHVEAPDEAGHAGLLDEKIQAIESFDAKVVGNVLKGLEALPAYRVLVTTDHNTPLSVRTHTREPVPFAIYGTGIPKPSSGHASGFSEESARERSLEISEGYRLMAHFLRSETGAA